MLDSISTLQKTNIDVFVMYDIACSLTKYLRVRLLLLLYSMSMIMHLLHVHRMLGETIFWRKFLYVCQRFTPMATKCHVR